MSVLTPRRRLIWIRLWRRANNRLLTNEELTNAEIKVRLAKLREQYKLTRLEIVVDQDSDFEEIEHIEGEINPRTKGPKKKRPKKHKSKLVRIEKGKYYLKDEFATKEYIRDSLYGKSYRNAVYDWMENLLSKPVSAGGLGHPTDSKLYRWNGAWWKISGTTRPSVDHTFPVVQHWKQIGRRTNQDKRKDYFNKISGMEVVPYSENSSAGAKLKSSYEKEVFIDFRGQGE